MRNNSPAPYSLRLPDKMRKDLQENAKKNGRTLHSEILLILENHLGSSSNPSDFDKRVRALIKEELSKK